MSARPELQALLAMPHYAPVMGYIAEQCGLTTLHSPLDGEKRIDPLELAGQKALRDFGIQFFKDFGWTLELVPPKTDPKARQALVETDGGNRG